MYIVKCLRYLGTHGMHVYCKMFTVSRYIHTAGIHNEYYAMPPTFPKTIRGRKLCLTADLLKLIDEHTHIYLLVQKLCISQI